jgi:hypothetical protein
MVGQFFMTQRGQFRMAFDTVLKFVWEWSVRQRIAWSKLGLRVKGK